MRLFTSRWQNKELAGLECVPVGISRGVPRFPTGYRYKLVRELAPGDEAWSTPDWPAFAAAYRRQLDELGIERILGRLERISREAGGASPVLLCYEADPTDCHRGLLLDWLRGHGLEVRELQPGDLPPRPDAPQPPLF